MPFLNNSAPVEFSRQQMRDALVWGLCALIAVFIALGSWLFQFRVDNTLISNNFGKTGETINTVEPLATASVLPRVMDPATVVPKRQNTDTGTTIVARQPALVKNQPQAPAAQQPGITAIGIDLGYGQSFSVLAKRYIALSEAAPILFSTLQPRATIVDTASGMEAHLIAGPIKSVAIAEKLCAKIRLRVEVTCAPADFSGKLLQTSP